MTDRIEFKAIKMGGPSPKSSTDAVAVFRNDVEIARLPEADRLTRAMRLNTSEIAEIVNNFRAIMGREPNEDEKQFWVALLEYKQNEQRPLN